MGMNKFDLSEHYLVWSEQASHSFSISDSRELFFYVVVTVHLYFESVAGKFMLTSSSRKIAHSVGSHRH